MAANHETKTPAKRSGLNPANKHKRRPPQWRVRLRKLFEAHPFASKADMARTLGVGPNGSAFRRWWEEDEDRPDGIQALRAEAIMQSIKPVDMAMLAEALGGDVGAAREIYRRAGVHEEADVRKAAAGAPAFNLNITVPGGNAVDLIKQIRGEIDRGAAARGPGVKHDDLPKLPGSLFLRTSEPVDAEFEHVEDTPHTPESQPASPGAPAQRHGRQVIDDEGSSRG